MGKIPGTNVLRWIGKKNADFFAQHIKFFSFMFICNFTYPLHLYLFNGRSLEFLPCMVLLGEVFVRLFVLVFLLTLICSFLPRWVRQALAAGTFLMLAIDAFTLYNYHGVLDEGMFQVVFETNPQEAMEYLQTQWKNILLAAAAVTTGGFLGRSLTGKGYTRLLHAHPVFLVVGIFLIFSGFGAATADAMLDPEQKLEDYQKYLSVERITQIVPDAYKEIGAAQAVYDNFDQKPVEITRNESSIPYVVFILGESTSRHHMQLYGYPLPDTPRLAQREKAGELLAFSDVISPHAGTMAVCKTLFTFYNNETPGEWYDYQDIFDIVKKAGYRTAWLSNQESSGFYGSIGRVYAERCDEGRFTMKTSHTIDLTERYDEQVLPLLDQTLQKSGERNFFVVHLMGAHEDFKRRYPAEFNVFQAENETGDTEEHRQVRAEYDNAVLYNDYIVDQILQRFEDKNAIVIYVSDHAEEVYDLRNVSGHGDETSSYQREIPMLVWTSASFRAAYPEQMERIRAAKDRPYMTDDMIHTLLDLLAVETPEYDASRSIFNPGFNAQRPRLLKGNAGYQKNL